MERCIHVYVYIRTCMYMYGYMGVYKRGPKAANERTARLRCSRYHASVPQAAAPNKDSAASVRSRSRSETSCRGDAPPTADTLSRRRPCLCRRIVFPSRGAFPRPRQELTPSIPRCASTQAADSARPQGGMRRACDQLLSVVCVVVVGNALPLTCVKNFTSCL